MGESRGRFRWQKKKTVRGATAEVSRAQVVWRGGKRLPSFWGSHAGWIVGQFIRKMAGPSAVRMPALGGEGRERFLGILKHGGEKKAGPEEKKIKVIRRWGRRRSRSKQGGAGKGCGGGLTLQVLIPGGWEKKKKGVGWNKGGVSFQGRES